MTKMKIEKYKKYGSLKKELPNLHELLADIASSKMPLTKHVADKIEKVLLQEMQLPHIEQEVEEVEPLSGGEGSTSSCYISVSNQNKKSIYKVFQPKEVDYLQEKNGYVWLIDNPTHEQCERFLLRFERFIQQGIAIKMMVEETNLQKKNPLNAPQLLLTSKGFVWQVENFYGSLLSDLLGPVYSSNEDIVFNPQLLLSRIELILQVAKNVQFLHKIKIFHGDIKPENFFRIDLDGGQYVIRNIDFDTCTTENQILNGRLDRVLATTKIFYNQDELTTLLKYKITDFKRWAALDIKALAKMLMLALDTKGNLYNNYVLKLPDVACEKNCDWYRPYINILEGEVFIALEAEKSLAAIYILNSIRELLRLCSDECYYEDAISTVDVFIERLLAIVNLMKFNYHLGDNHAVTSEIIRCAGFKMLDADSQRKGVKYDASETVKQVLKDYFVS